MAIISSLMVTQPGKEEECEQSIKSFTNQKFKEKELIIIHDGGLKFHRILQGIVEKHPNHHIEIHREPQKSLGLLRNRSIELANCPYVCQWDDDDLSHPDRLSIQFEYLQNNEAEFCFMTDQLHLFSEQKLLFWDDWRVENPPGHLIQGTLLGRRDLIGAYPDLAVGEDTDLVMDLVNRDCKIAAMSGFGWMYIYTYNGRNAWGESHHKAISNWKRLKYDALMERLPLLQAKLLDYQLPYRSLSMLHERGKFEIPLNI